MDLIEDALSERFTAALRDDPERFPHYSAVAEDEHTWNHRQLLRNLAQSVRTRHRGHFRTYCLDLAHRRAGQGVAQDELRAALATFDRICRQQFGSDPRAAAVSELLYELVTRTIDFGLDGIEEAYEELGPEALPT